MQDQTLRAWQLLCDSVPNEEALTEIEKRSGFYRTRSIKSGDLLEVEAYPILPQSLIREALKKCPVSKEAQRRLNQRNAEKRLMRLMETNFGAGDWYFTATLEGANLPTLDGMRKKIQRFISRMNYHRKARGMDNARYIYVIEGYEEGSRQKRLHVHFVIDGGLGREELKTIWGHGRCKCDELDPDSYGGLINLAKYLSKDPRGRKRWAASKGLAGPVIHVAERKINHRAARKIAESPAGAAAALEKLYPGYEHVETEVRSNPFIPGCYIYAILRRKGDGKHERGHIGGQAGDRAGAHAGRSRSDAALRVPPGGEQKIQKCRRQV